MMTIFQTEHSSSRVDKTSELEKEMAEIKEKAARVPALESQIRDSNQKRNGLIIQLEDMQAEILNFKEAQLKQQEDEARMIKELDDIKENAGDAGNSGINIVVKELKEKMGKAEEERAKVRRKVDEQTARIMTRST